MARLTIRIDLDDEAGFGPGKAELLETLDRTGSIRSAAAAMDMSYRRAWLLVQDIEKTVGAPVVDARTGGVGGGGVRLTELGRNVVERYRRIERSAARAVASELIALDRVCAKGSRRGRVLRRKSIRRHREEGVD